jgi:MFS family permease
MKDSDAGDVERRLKTQQIWEALKDFNCWSNVFIAGATSIPNAVFSSFSTPVIHGFGYSDFDSLLLLMPLGAAAMVGVYGSGWITRRFDGWRYRMLLLCCMPALTGSLMCWLLPRSHPAAL